ncbi:MAG: SPFH domain-containing protein [Dehalococcoidia bacterium]|jgi:regulator of protease activity HflC (stomatin/prohibitin superfamily)|nr:SPFH domain-containing protein [Dehalococcoidia bacterium]
MGLFIVRQYERLVVFRLGQFTGVREPGIRWLWPILENGTKTDLREFFSEIPRQTTITKDNAPIDIDFLVYMRVMDDRPEDTVLKVQNFQLAAQGLAMTTLRAVIGDITLDEVLSKRDEINLVLRSKLDEATEGWGVRVTRVEIREIDPPRDIQDAMNRQMAAERDRRATVTSAEGERQAQVTRAEGERQAAILQAEGERQATILEAEGRRQAAILNAEGFSIALERINAIAQTADARTMSLQYFDTLKELGSSESTKFIFPMEFTSMLQPLLSGFGQGAGGNGDGAADADQPTSTGTSS